MPRKRRGRIPAMSVPPQTNYEQYYQYQRENAHLGEGLEVPPLPNNMNETLKFCCPLCGMWSSIQQNPFRPNEPSLEAGPYGIRLAAQRFGGGYGRISWYEFEDPELEQEIINKIANILPEIEQELGIEVVQPEKIIKYVPIPESIEERKLELVKPQTKLKTRKKTKKTTPVVVQKSEYLEPELLSPEQEKEIGAPEERLLLEEPPIEIESETYPENDAEILERLIEKWTNTRKKNAAQAMSDLELLRHTDTEEAKIALELYQDIQRGDYDTKEEYQKEKEAAWENFLDALQGLYPGDLN